MRSTRYQKRAYAMRRLSRAVDRMIVSKTEADKARAARWVMAWKLAT